MHRLRGVSARPDDLGVLDAQHRSRLLTHPAQLGLERPAAEQVRRDLGEQRRFALALLGIRRAATVPGCQLADDDRGPGVSEQREPVRRIGQRERMDRGRKNQLKASMLATATGSDQPIPHAIATGSTANT